MSQGLRVSIALLLGVGTLAIMSLGDKGNMGWTIGIYLVVLMAIIAEIRSRRPLQRQPHVYRCKRCGDERVWVLDTRREFVPTTERVCQQEHSFTIMRRVHSS